MDKPVKCPTCRSTKIDFTESINRLLYGAIYALVLVVIGWIGITVKGTPVIFLFLGLGGAFVLFVIRLALEQRKVTKCKCLDCGARWQTGRHLQR